MGLGWDANSSSTGADFDLDASVFILGENKKCLSDEYFVFYNNLKSPDGAVEHTGDNLSGAGEGDDESIKVDLSKINPNATEISNMKGSDTNAGSTHLRNVCKLLPDYTVLHPCRGHSLQHPYGYLISNEIKHSA